MLRDNTPFNGLVAEQIAELLNRHNKLTSKYHGFNILNSKAVYLPLHLFGLVFGNVAVNRINFFLSEIKHLVVHEKLRGLDIGSSLVETALMNVTTPLVFATIREDNIASIRIFEKKNFKKVAKAEVDGHNVLMYLRKK